MNKIVACIDASPYAASVCDHAAWCSLRLDAPLEFLHVPDRPPEVAESTDYSGSLAMDAHITLLDKLAELDAQRSKLAQEQGRILLADARQRAIAAGVDAPQSQQRHGPLLESLTERVRETRMIVMGHHHHSDTLEKHHLDHTLERVIRSVDCPVLAVTPSFRPPQSFLIAFDGSATGRKTVEKVARSPLLRDLACHVVIVGSDAAFVESQLAWAQTTLTSAGFKATTARASGEPEPVLSRYVEQHALDLLVMGAYGHSRIRQMIVGSTTTTLLRTSNVPVLVLR